MAIDLHAYRALVDQELTRRIDACNVSEHLIAILRGYLQGGGKRLRPLLLMLSCGGFGGDAMAVVPAAAATEMYHNWTLIHDDIIDHDPFRRGRPTSHVIGRAKGEEDFALKDDVAADYGVSTAILAGDLLQGLAFQALCDVTKVAPEAIRAVTALMGGWLGPELIGGEQLDVELSHIPFEKVTADDVNRMMRGKTGALLAYAVQCGAILAIGKAEDERVTAMHDFGIQWGLSFQLQDDLLGIFGDEKTFGKPVGSDIREGKRTLLALQTLQSLKGSARQQFLSLYGKADVTEADIADVRELMAPAAKVIRRQARHLLDVSLDILAATMPQCPERQALVDITNSMMNRQV